jgi:restriction endonuclease S subunit
MMVSLNRGGRCAVVVPDGMLVNGSSCHNETRKYLLDHFELKRVIKMKGQFFMNTGIQPSILFFENTGKPTSVVEFWDVIKGVNGDIDETMVLSVPRAKFDTSCSFDMRRYQQVKVVANPAGFPMVKLSEACEVSKGKRCLVSVESGGYPYQDVAHISRMVEKCILDTPAVLTPRAMSIGRFVYTDEKCHPSDDMFILKPKDNLNAKYLYYYCLLNLSTKFKESLHGVKPTIDYSVFDYTHIIIPPLETQQEIVATLDRIYAPGTTELSETIKLTDKAMDLVLAGATAQGGASLEPIVEAQRLMRKSAQMVTDVKAQMVADVKAQMVAVIRASSIRSTSAIRSLNDVCSVSFGERITQKNNKGTLYPVYGGGEANFHTDRFNREGKTCKVARFAVSEKSMVLMINDKYWLMDSGFTVTSKVKDSVHDEFLWWILWANQKIISECSTGSCQKNIAMDMFYKLEFGFPSIEIQTQTLQRLNALQTQLSSLENLGKQAEDNARFILDSYLNTA